MEEEIERREAALAASPALQPKFQSGVSQDQLKKFQELRKRRLQIKQRSKIQKKSKGGASGATKACEKGLSINDGQDEHAAVMLEDSSSSTAKANTSLMGEDTTSLLKDEVEPYFGLKKRKKLHWGLDTKERWERKANM